MEATRKQEEIVGLWPIPEMAQKMRVEHDRLAQLGWVYDGFGGYRKKAASSRDFAVATCDFNVVYAFRRRARAGTRAP
jgi:hypothetical protein